MKVAFLIAYIRCRPSLLSKRKKSQLVPYMLTFGAPYEFCTLYILNSVYAEQSAYVCVHVCVGAIVIFHQVREVLCSWNSLFTPSVRVRVSMFSTQSSAGSSITGCSSSRQMLCPGSWVSVAVTVVSRRLSTAAAAVNAVTSTLVYCDAPTVVALVSDLLVVSPSINRHPGNT